MQACPAHAEGQGCGDSLIPGDADASGPMAKPGQVRAWRASGRSTTACREEQEARTLLVGVAEQAAVGILPMLRLNVVDVGGFIVESSIAVLGGAAIGLIGSWYLRRQERKERRD